MSGFIVSPYKFTYFYNPAIHTCQYMYYTGIALCGKSVSTFLSVFTALAAGCMFFSHHYAEGYAQTVGSKTSLQGPTKCEDFRPEISPNMVDVSS